MLAATIVFAVGASAQAGHQGRPRTALIRRDSLCSTPRNRLTRAVWGFEAPWDPASHASLKCHASFLDAAVTGWMRLDTLGAMPQLAYPDTDHLPERSRRFALVTTYSRDRFHRETVRQLAADRQLGGSVAGAIAHLAVIHRYRGLILDFEGLIREDTAALDRVVRTITDSAHRHGIRPIVVAVVPTDTTAYAARHLRSADALLLMLYDEHWATGAPGPVASPAWVRQALALRAAETSVRRLVAALPVYGYLWRPTAGPPPYPPAAVLGFEQARRVADSAGATITRDSASSTLHFTRPGSDSAEAWVADATLFDVLASAAESLGVHRFALWRLGLEDPALWTEMDRPRRSTAPHRPAKSP